MDLITMLTLLTHIPLTQVVRQYLNKYFVTVIGLGTTLPKLLIISQ
jgi:hypothetical protein